MADEERKAPLGFVKGGTPTTKSEQLYEQRFQEAEKRRDVSAEDRKHASVPIEQGGGQLHTSQFTRHPEIPRAYIPLVYVNAHGETIQIRGQDVICCADLIIGMDATKPTELTLILVCPRCMQQGQKHQQDCQMTVRQSNKRFEFKAGMGPSTFIFEGKTYRSAGMVVQSESFKCADCGWSARIDHNRVWPD